ncbi:NAD-dependent epimerase/dehydratase family protein [Gordonia sp. NB41Y]|uniref:NAD-dependent epimerase/dehydratase family protein n=1 Tax=Gordonia sp. NB41Y TaxID=875808 RepID=UPI0002BD349B|nr:NAD-dependent epimerase/dehydratase family protein [Gordonia sp. NB41Y]EMP13575.1 NAD-dependent epimerase [Gordonia sp. NB41Y]WLP90738.1 NAD-dependent epimerase/dehydratase family protein [Gordonia sp. NB41Y]
MQTVLGANGQIAEVLTDYLYENITDEIRLVSRNPVRRHDTDQLLAADLTDPDAASRAVQGSDIAYLTVGLPMDSTRWERQFPAIMANTIAACREHGTKLVFFDNTYMYPRTSTPQTEDAEFRPAGRKSVVRATIATMLLDEMRTGAVDAVICRAPEFYGPGKTKSLTNSAVFDRIRQGRRAMIPVSAHTRRSLIWTPDAARAMGLIGNTPDAYGQTWHLPVDPARPSYADMISVAREITGHRIRHATIPAVAFTIGSLFDKSAKEVSELIPRYGADNIFDSTKFAARFPDFPITPYRQGIGEILDGRP